jgi:hypothetical protein
MRPLGECYVDTVRDRDMILGNNLLSGTGPAQDLGIRSGLLITGITSGGIQS